MPWKSSCQRKAALFERRDLDLDANQLDQLRSIEHQYKISDSLLGFIDCMSGAFEHLQQARGALKADGMSISSDTAAMEDMLLNTFGEAYDNMSSLIKIVRPQLETCRATVLACVDDLQEAERTASKAKIHLKSFDKLVKKDASGSSIQKMQGKLGPATHSASVARTRALDSLQGCSTRQRELCQATRKIMDTTSQAVQVSIRPLTAGCPLPTANTCLALADIPERSVADEEIASASTGLCVGDTESKDSESETSSQTELPKNAYKPFVQTVATDGETW